MAKGFLYDNGDELITREDVSEVPSGSSANIGDVLSLDSNKKPKWTTPESELPSTTSASAGDVLSLDSDKDPVWSTPSCGEVEIVHAVYVPSNGTVYFTEMNSETHLTMTEVFEKLENGAFLDGDVGLSKFSKIEYQETEYMIGYCVFLVASVPQCRWINMVIAESNDTSLDVSEQDQFIWSIEAPAQ